MIDRVIKVYFSIDYIKTNMKKNLEFKERIRILEKAEKNLRYKIKSLEIGLCISVALLIAAGFKIFIS